MNKSILIALVVAVVGVGAIVYFNNNEAAEEQENNRVQEQIKVTEDDESSEEPGAQVVTYTDNGFSPATLLVTKGTTVTFKNESSLSLWVAADPHPTHTSNVTFDNKRGIGNGEIYEFTFTEAGDWKYHNHLSSRDGGTIVVQ